MRDTAGVEGRARSDDPVSSSLTSTRRLLLAFAAGLVAGLFCFWLRTRPTSPPSDFLYPWTAARVLLAGGNPYAAIPGGRPEPFSVPFYYPLTTVLATVPFAHLPVAAATALFFGLSTTLLAWHLTRRGPEALLLLASAPFIAAAYYGQWSPLVTVAALSPAWGWLASLKPNLGLAALVARPSWRGVLGAGAVGAASLVVRPTWPLDWLHAVRGLIGHPAPIATLAGAPVLLALLRWRRPEARLLLAMACVPQVPLFYDQLALGLVAGTRQEHTTYALLTQLAFAAAVVLTPPGKILVDVATPWVVAGCYLPALVMVLRRPDRPGDQAAPR